MSSEQLWAARLIPVSVPAQKVQSEPPSRRYGEDCGQRRAALSLSLSRSLRGVFLVPRAPCVQRGGKPRRPLDLSYLQLALICTRGPREPGRLRLGQPLQQELKEDPPARPGAHGGAERSHAEV